jgi:hypothetical protein
MAAARSSGITSFIMLRLLRKRLTTGLRWGRGCHRLLPGSRPWSQRRPFGYPGRISSGSEIQRAKPRASGSRSCHAESLPPQPPQLDATPGDGQHPAAGPLARLCGGCWLDQTGTGSSRSMGAKRGANGGRHQATPGHSQRSPSLVNGTLSLVEPRPATGLTRLTSEGSQDRNLLRPPVWAVQRAKNPGDHRGVRASPGRGAADRCAGHERVATMTR